MNNPKIPHTKMFRFWPRSLKFGLQFGSESLIWGNEVKRLSERWKLNTKTGCELGLAVKTAFINRAKFWWIFTFKLSPEYCFKQLIDLLGGRRGLHSTWLCVLISSTLQGFYRMIPLPNKLPVNPNVKWTGENTIFRLLYPPTTWNFLLWLGI